MIYDSGEYLARSSVISVDELSNETNELKDQMAKFTKKLESKVANSVISNNPENIYYTPFRVKMEEDSVDLPHWNDFTDLSSDEIETRHSEELDDLIEADEGIECPGQMER